MLKNLSIAALLITLIRNLVLGKKREKKLEESFEHSVVRYLRLYKQVKDIERRLCPLACGEASGKANG